MGLHQIIQSEEESTKECNQDEVNVDNIHIDRHGRVRPPLFFSCPIGYLNMVPIDQYGGEPEWRAQVIKHHENKREKRRSRAIIV